MEGDGEKNENEKYKKENEKKKKEKKKKNNIPPIQDPIKKEIRRKGLTNPTQYGVPPKTLSAKRKKQRNSLGKGSQEDLSIL